MGAGFSDEHLSKHDGSQDPLRLRPVRLKTIPTKDVLSSIEKTCNEWLETIKSIKSGRVEYNIHEYLHMRLNETVQQFQEFFEYSPEKPQRDSRQQRSNQQPHDRPFQRQQAMSPRGGHHGKQQMQLQEKLPHTDQMKEYQRKIDQLEIEREEERQINKALESLAELEDSLSSNIKKQRYLLTRLSTVVGEKICHNKPDIAVPGDPYRPTKIGEQFSELYDDEWTDAFDELESAGYTEREAIDTLRLTLESTYAFCGEKSEAFISRVKSVFTDETNPETQAMLSQKVSEINQKKSKLQARWKPKEESKAKKPSNKEYDFEGKLKQLRKEEGLAMIPMVQQAYMKEMWSSSEHVASLKPFIRKCLFVCWFMVIQTPPMCIELGDLHGQKFEKDRFKAYTCEGQQIDYMVWPPLRLHDKGPLMTKGIVQGIYHGLSRFSKE